MTTMPSKRTQLKVILVLFILSSVILPACIPTPSAVQPTESSSAETPSPTQLATIIAPVLSTPASLPHLQIEESQLDGIEILFGHPWTGTPAQTTQELVNQFNQENSWGIRVKINEIGSTGLLNDFVEKNFNGPDQANIIAAPMEQLALWQEKANVIINLDDYIQDPKWGFSQDEISNFYPVFWDQGIYDSRRLGIPAYRDAQILFYNQSWAQDLGFTNPPQTSNAFEMQICAAAKDVKLKSNDGTGGWIINTAPLSMLSWIRTFGGGNIQQFDNQEYSFNTPQTQEAFSFLKKIQDEDCAWNSRLASPYEYFSNRQALIYAGTLMDIPSQMNSDKKFETSDKWTIIPYPSNAQEASMISFGPSYAILVDGSERQLAAWLFIRWMSDPERQAEIAFATGTFPLGPASSEILKDLAKTSSKWEAINPSLLEAAPGSPSWTIVRSVLSDAAWQTFQSNTKSEDIPIYLETIDSTIQELIPENQ